MAKTLGSIINAWALACLCQKQRRKENIGGKLASLLEIKRKVSMWRVSMATGIARQPWRQRRRRERAGGELAAAARA